VVTDPVLVDGQQAARIAPELGHVLDAHLLGGGPERVAHQLKVGVRKDHQDGLAGRRGGDDEIPHRSPNWSALRYSSAA